MSDSGFSGNKEKNFWNTFWKKNKDSRSVSWTKRRIISVVAPYLKKAQAILDAGCGSGFFSSYFISSGLDVYSLDYSSEALFAAKRLTENKAKSYIQADILDRDSLFNIGRKFDIVFTDGLLEHYSNDEQDRMLQNLKDLKEKGGYLINFAPNRFSLWSLVRPFYIRIGERPYSMREFLNLHARNGFNIVAYGGINVLPFRFSPERLGAQYGMLLYCIAM